MAIEISERARKDAVASLQKYAEENLPEPIGDLAAGIMLDFFLEEVGPVIYNSAIRDAQTRLQVRIGDLSGELFEDEFQYWPKLEKKRKRRK
ncbi:MAG: DUF2164 domain-containing protein [Bryocella sp.]